MKDIKYIIKRIIIGIGIALALMFIRQNVFAYEWETDGDVLINDIYFKSRRYYVLPRRSGTSTSEPVYPQTVQSTYYDFLSSSITSTSGSPIGNTTIPGNTRSFGPYFIQSERLDFTGTTFYPNINYYVIVPYGYNNNVFSSLSSNVNEDKILDSSTYTTNSNYTSISSASLSFGIPNDLENPATFSYYYYFKIAFTVSEEVNDLIIDIGTYGSQNFIFTGYNTYSFDNYLLKSNFLCNSWVANSTCSYRSERMYFPFIYTHVAGSIYPSGGSIADSTSNDIKTEIQQIIDGQFTDDLNLPDLNGGGRKFGDNEYSLQDLLLMPIEFIQKLTTSNTCVSPSVPVPGLNGTMQLPCLTSFATSILGSEIVDMIKIILGCILGFKIIVALYNSILHILSPDHLLWVDDIF